MGPQQREKLPRHHRAETLDMAAFELCPFGMGSRMADQTIRRDEACLDRPEDLDFLAAHHIWNVIGRSADAGDKERPVPILLDGRSSQSIEPDRTAHIGRFVPSDA